LKVFIVFMALLVLNVGFLGHSADMDRYARLQRQLKWLAEEGASGAALLRDEAEYSAGRLCVDRQAAEGYIAYLLEHHQSQLLSDPSSAISAHMEVYDEKKGYEGADAYGIPETGPAVALRLEWDGPDLFRLPFLTVTHLERTVTYQWSDGLTSSFE
jgi:hypothetical protein